MLDLVLFISMLSGAKYVADSNERDRARTRRQGAKGRAAGARYDRNQAAIWRERWQRERQAHGKTKGERKQAGAAARESQRLHQVEVKEHQDTVKRYDAGLIHLIKVTWTPKTRMGALLKLVRSHINAIRSSKVPARSKRGGKIR